MSSSSDSPLVRFAAFWWAIGVFSLFAVILLALKLFSGDDADQTNPLEDAAAAKRYEVAAKIKAAQEANLVYKEVEKGKVVQVPPHDVFKHIGEGLVSAKPAAVEKPEQLMPGQVSKVAGLDVTPALLEQVNKLTPPAGTAPDPAVMEAAKATYALCSVCHGPNGEGVSTPAMMGPPFAGNEWINGPVSNLIRIQFRGLEGPIHLKGEEKTYVGLMAPLIAGSKDEEIAAVLTYIRNSFGNKAAPVLPEQVKMLRGEIGGPLKEADLIKPTPAP